ncbi:unnamed protein product [Cylindrotheca closterium]|uniref:Uncharacterized protein n=1 Tax=Cylindrotheca closterium TaxID=2856 RepID=A0AAD2GD37_9STRA|nr:unnamed protein product [Cylindrotheca closterium]CAJ1970306.1 unnamed protein product [Cylindrotheca closterium]
MNEEHRYTGQTTTELIKRTGEQPPKHANGRELCLIWHTKGECKENCEHDAAPDIDKLPHPAAPMLHRVMKNGAPVVVHSEPWSQSQLDMRVARGCHSSANEFKEFLMEEFLDFGRKGFWILLPYDAIKDEKGLCLSPNGCVPQDNRRPRMIVDYSFWGLNDKTMKLAPEGAMQFGTAPLRIREALMKANPDYGPVYMYKNDMSDGFYRIRLSTTGALKLGVILPRFEGLPQLVALPLVLPMGCTESPPWFCAFTETVADLTNVDLQQNKRVPPHPLGKAAAITDFEVRDAQVVRPIPKSHQPLTYQRPLKKMEVFVDDFVGMGQDHPSNPLTNQRAVLSHNIDKVFQPNRPTNNQWRKEPQSQSKMAKGDASWHTIKEALGWNWGATTKTLQLKEKRVSKALSLLGKVLDCKRVSLKRWQQVLGVLRSLQPGMSGSEGHFSLLQDALIRQVDCRVRLTPEVHEQLEIFQDFLHGHAKRPTTLEELVPGVDLHVGACDAAKSGRGGVWFTDDGEAIVWREPYQEAVKKEVISDHNLTGKLTNSDLELEGTVLHHFVLGKTAQVEGETTYTGCDDTPAVSWRTKGLSTSRKARARILRLAAGLQREQRAHHHQLLATVQDAKRRELLDDIRAVELRIEHGVCPSKVAKAYSVWTTWVAFCDSLTLDPGLSAVDDPLLIILLFGTQWRHGKIAPSKRQVRGQTAEAAMRQVGQAFSSLGLLNLRMNRYAPGTMDFCWTPLLKSWKKEDPAAQRVRPLPKSLSRQASKLAKKPTSTHAAKLMHRLMWLGFFFLLRSGKFLSKGGTQFPFKLKQVFFHINDAEFRGDVIPLRLLDMPLVTFAGLIFDKQKKTVPDKKI